MIVDPYGGFSDYDFRAALSEALATAPKRDEFADADTVYWRRFEKQHGAPTQKELARHVKLYGRQGTEPFIGTEAEAADVLAFKSAKANLKEADRKRSRRSRSHAASEGAPRAQPRPHARCHRRHAQPVRSSREADPH